MLRAVHLCFATLNETENKNVQHLFESRVEFLVLQKLNRMIVIFAQSKHYIFICRNFPSSSFNLTASTHKLQGIPQSLLAI